MHLCGIRKTDGRYQAPSFEALRAARPLAIFSYLTHIIRDFQKDHQRHLNYFPNALLRKHEVTLDQLHAAASGEEIPVGLRAIVGQYVAWIDYYRTRSLRELEGIQEYLTPQYRMSLAIIYGLYQQIVDRISPTTGTFTGLELNPSPTEVRDRIEKIIVQQEDKELIK